MKIHLTQYANDDWREIEKKIRRKTKNKIKMLSLFFILFDNWSHSVCLHYFFFFFAARNALAIVAHSNKYFVYRQNSIRIVSASMKINDSVVCAEASICVHFFTALVGSKLFLIFRDERKTHSKLNFSIKCNLIGAKITNNSSKFSWD